MSVYYDIHCHVFNKNVILRKLVNVVQTAVAISEMLDDRISKEELEYKINSIARTLEEVTQDSSEGVFNLLDSAYSKKFVITPLMFDLTYADDNDDTERRNNRYRRRIKNVFRVILLLVPVIKFKVRRKFHDDRLNDAIDNFKESVKEFKKNFEVKTDEDVEIFDDANYVQQIAELEYIATHHKNVRPFFSIDPRREYKGKQNLVALLKEKILDDNARFGGVKLYAPAGFSPTDPVLMGTSTQKGVYAFCQENKIPITVHNSNAGFACLSSVIKVRGHVNLNHSVIKMNGKLTFDNKFFSKHVGDAIKERARKLNHPKLWKLVLAKHPDLHINFAHFGGSGQIMEYVNYDIPITSIDVDEFEDMLSAVLPQLKRIIQSAYVKKRKRMVLKELNTTDRAKVWNAMYRADIIDNWAKAIFDTVRNPRYKNAFTDLSCFSDGALIHDPADPNHELTYSIKENLSVFRSLFYDRLTEYEQSKFLYGTDFFLAQFFGPTVDQYLSDFKTIFGDEFEQIASANPEHFLNVKPLPVLL